MENQSILSATTEKEPFNFMDYLKFKRMITLQVIPVLYAAVAVIITLGSLVMIFSGGGRRGYYDDFTPGGGVGFVLLIIGNVIWRMWCELILVLFRVNKNLQNIDKNTKPVLDKS